MGGGTKAIAMGLSRQGKYEEAEMMQKQVDALSERIHGKEHPITQWSIYNLGRTLKGMGKLEDVNVLLCDLEML
jgi:hypothetical protein